MNMCAVAGDASIGTRWLAVWRRRRARARPTGLPVSSAAPASAAYSRERETASWTSNAAIGATIAIASSPRTPPPSRSRSPPKPPKIAPHLAIVARNETAPAIVAAIEPIRMSRWRTWESSCARTPASSASFIRSSSPSVTATAACCGLRPVAKAFGWRSGITKIRGRGRPARATSPSTIRSTRGASPGAISCAPYWARTILSENQ